MNHWVKSVGVLVLGVVAVAGCGGDPLAGQWRNQRNSNGEAITTTLVFKGSGFVDITIVSLTDTAAPMLAGCTSTQTTLNAGYTTSGQGTGMDTPRNISFNGAGVCTLARTGCVDASLNQGAMACPAGTIGLGSAAGTYVVTATGLTLTLTGQPAALYTR